VVLEYIEYRTFFVLMQQLMVYKCSHKVSKCLHGENATIGYSQIGNPSFSDSCGNGFDGCAHGVEKGCKLPCSFGFSAFFQDKPSEGHHIGIKCTSV